MALCKCKCKCANNIRNVKNLRKFVINYCTYYKVRQLFKEKD